MVKPPRSHPDDDLDLQMYMEARIHSVMDEALSAGWTAEQVYLATKELVVAWALAIEADRETWSDIEDR